MSKSKSAAAKRPSPPDRDGDGRPGGSLPGNETVEAAKGPEAEAEPQLTLETAPETAPTEAEATPETAPAEAEAAPETAPGEAEAAPETAPAEAEAAPETAPAEAEAAPETALAEWTRDDDYLLDLLVSNGADLGGRSEAEVIEAVNKWSDEEARAVEKWAEDALLTTVQLVPPAPETLTATFTPADLEAPPAEGDTFSAEEIAAGETALVQEEGESAIAAAMAAPVIADTDPLVTIETATAPVALRLGNLRRLVENRLFYKSPEGFSPNYHAPHVDEAEVQVWIDNGLARWDETAGRIGGVYAEPEAGRALRGQSQQAAA